MRLGKFESAGLEPLGEGEQKKSFIDPEDEARIISEMRPGTERDTARQLKGRFYLTKIAHLLLPKNIPDVYQAGESRDGMQTIDTERITHSPGHALLQAARRAGADEELAREQIVTEMGAGMSELDDKLADIGLGFNVDANVGNYTQDAAGDVYYLETLKPWQADAADPQELEALFDAEAMRQAIDGLTDPAVKEQCRQYLARLSALLEEEKQEWREQHKANLAECGPHVADLEAMMAPLMQQEFLVNLYALKTEADALESPERSLAKKALIPILKNLNFLEAETNITSERYSELQAKFRMLNRGVGMINGGKVDHNR